MAITCEICGVDCNKRYNFSYPNSNNQYTTKQICKECHESLRVIINQFIDSITSYNSKSKGYYPVIFPNTQNEETTKYISYDDHKALEKKINTFIDNGGI